VGAKVVKLLLVEDDFLIGDGIQRALGREGFSVNWAKTKDDAEAASSSQNYDLIVLDIRLPDGSGLDLLRNLRKSHIKTPVLMLTALNSTTDRVSGLDTGADDYLAKPFEMSELSARIRALHRRSLGIAHSLLSVRGIILDPASHRVTKNGEVVDLGVKEFSILKTLFERVGRVVTKTELEDSLYGWEEEVSSNAIEVLIHRIRKKLDPEIIKTIRGVGYVTQEKNE
jgi:DNA-binding response OmpR family regulator